MIDRNTHNYRVANRGPVAREIQSLSKMIDEVAKVCEGHCSEAAEKTEKIINA